MTITMLTMTMTMVKALTIINYKDGHHADDDDHDDDNESDNDNCDDDGNEHVVFSVSVKQSLDYTRVRTDLINS